MTQSQDNAAADVLIREVDEELRHDRYTMLWRKYGSLALAAAVAIVLSVAGWQVWQTQQTKARTQSSDRFAAALTDIEQGKTDDALKALSALAKDGTDGYRVIALLQQAELLVAANDTAGARTIYLAVATNSSFDQIYRDLGTIKASYLDLDAKTASEADLAIVVQRVAPLTADASPWRHAAREITALAALRGAKAPQALDLFKTLSDDPSCPQGIRMRAAEMLKILQPRNG